MTGPVPEARVGVVQPCEKALAEKRLHPLPICAFELPVREASMNFNFATEPSYNGECFRLRNGTHTSTNFQAKCNGSSENEVQRVPYHECHRGWAVIPTGITPAGTAARHLDARRDAVIGGRPCRPRTERQRSTYNDNRRGASLSRDVRCMMMINLDLALKTPPAENRRSVEW